MSDLVTWLRVQLDEDERVAREASGDAWVTGTSAGYKYSRPGDVYAIGPGKGAARIAVGTACGPDITAEQSSEHIARHHPARVLAEVEAKRHIIDAYLPPGKDPHPGLPCTHDIEGDPDGRHYYPDEDGCMRHILASRDRFHGDYLLRLLAAPFKHRPGWRDEWKTT